MAEINFQNATQVCLGDISADVVYLGADEIWRKPAAHGPATHLGGGGGTMGGPHGLDRSIAAPVFTLTKDAHGINMSITVDPGWPAGSEIEIEESTDGHTWNPVGFPFSSTQGVYDFTPASSGNLQYRLRVTTGTAWSPWSAVVSIAYP